MRTVRLSELTKPNRSLVIYYFMFGKGQTKACPLCTSSLDGANSIAHHLAQNFEFAVVAAADLPTLRSLARERGWDKLRLLSAGNDSFKDDLGSEDREGGQDSTVSVFTRDPKGNLHHFYAAHPRMAPDIQQRGIDLLTYMALHGPNRARTGQLVHKSCLRHQSPCSLHIARVGPD